VGVTLSSALALNVTCTGICTASSVVVLEAVMIPLKTAGKDAATSPDGFTLTVNGGPAVDPLSALSNNQVPPLSVWAWRV
jgi:hypothetical protein